MSYCIRHVVLHEAGARDEYLNPESQANISFPQGKKYCIFSLLEIIHRKKKLKIFLLQSVDGSMKDKLLKRTCLL